MTSATFAVQPSSWSQFDSKGCDWAKDIDHAYQIAKAWGEDCIIWRIPQSGNAIAWVKTEFLK